MKLKIVVGIFAILLLGGTVTPAISQTESLADHVVINEVEVNPPGLDAGSPIEWVELYNPTDTAIDISGWKISSSPSADRTYSIPQGTMIFPGKFLFFFYTSAWFNDVAEVVQLLDDQGNLIDETPALTDISNDNISWQRKTNGFDSNSDGDWINKFSTPGKSNGEEIRAFQQSNDLEISVSSDKDAYVFGETAKISGEVSKKVYVQKPSFVVDTIDMKITGPGGFSRDLTLFPDYNLNFRTTLKLDSVLEIREGVYDVFVEYGGVTDFAQFTVGHQASIIAPTVLRLLSVTTDEISYIPNQRITITAHATELIPFAALKYKVQDPSGAVAIEGSVFPNQEELSRYMKTNRFSKGGTAELNPESQFITRGLIDPIAPIYGTYLVTAEYGSNTARTTFDLTADEKEDVLISLITDKPAYGLGETVTISGRLNGFWVPSLDLEIAQSGILSIQGSRGQTDNAKLFKHTNAVRLEGDSTFEYQYNIPRTANALGDWRVLVDKDIGTEITFFKVVENPDEYFDDTKEIFFVATDKDIYDINETVNIFGRINDIQYNSQQYTGVVKLQIKSEEGKTILNPTNKPSGNKPLGSVFEKTSIPDDSGVFKVNEPLYRAKYAAGNYIVKASYDLPSVSKGARVGDTAGGGIFTDTTKFTVRDTLYEAGFSVTLDKSIYGLGEKVHLTGTYPQSAQGVGITITMKQPNGVQREFGTLVDNGRFSWTWTTPVSEKTNRVENERAALVSTTAVTSSNFGVYKLIVGTDTGSRNVFFKVSPNPEVDFISLEPITVSTDKSVYKTAEKIHIIGNAQRVEQGNEGLVIPYRVEIKVETVGFPTSSFTLHGLASDKNIGGSDFPIKRLKSTEAYLDNGGNFKATIDLPPTVFIGGTYKVSAIYQGQKAQTTFEVENDFVIQEQNELVRTNPVMLISTDKEEYERGETVFITARPNKNIFLETVKVAIPSEESRKINCGAFVCGPGTTVTELRPDERTATFYHEQKIPKFGTAAGAGFQSAGTEKNPRPMPDNETYFVAIQAEFGTFTKPITVWNVPKPIEVPSLEERITEKFNRITESHVDINIDEKIINGEEFAPRVLQGSLFTPNRGQESQVNVRVVTQSGVCLIGPDPDCTVRESTRSPGSIYQKVSADGNEYKVRYSGHEAKLEKFTILPVDPDGALPDMDWDIDVQKEDQSSHFYYKVTYVDDKETI